MSLADCLKKLNSGKTPLFKDAEMKEIRALANQKTEKLNQAMAEKAAVQSMLDHAYADQKMVADLIREAQGEVNEQKPAEAEAISEEPRASDISNMSADDFDALVSEVEAEQNPAAALFTGRSGKLPDQKTSVKIAGEAVGHVFKGVGKGFAGLDALFGRKGTLGSGLAFDEDTWAKAKPLFKEAFDEFVAAGNSAKEFVRHIIGRYGNGVAPYLKRWHSELSAPVTDAAEQKAEKKPAKPKTDKTAEPRVEKMQDVGEKMEGKRADRITKDLRDNATGNKKKDLQKILDLSTKASVWKIDLAEGSTSGTKVYLERVRDNLKSFLEFAGEKAGGSRRTWRDSFSDALAKYMESGAEQRAEVEKMAGEYISAMEQLRDATNGAMTVEQARAALETLIVEKTISKEDADAQSIGYGDADYVNTEWTDGKRETTYTLYTDAGKSLAKYSRKGSLTNIYSTKYGLSYDIKDDASRTRAKPLVRPKLEQIVRTNMKDHRNGKDVSGQDFIDTFGFRAAEFGDWVNSKERQINVNLAFDAFHDLADTLGIDAKSISLGGKLGMAFGSRGQGKASAHYEPGNVVINLTKTRGDGTVAHEWGHALDYALRKASNSKGALAPVDHPSGRGYALLWTNKDAGYFMPPESARADNTPTWFATKDEAKEYAIREMRSISQVDAGQKAVNDLKRSLKNTYDTAYAIKIVDSLLSGSSTVRGQRSQGALQMAQNYIQGKYWQNASWGVVKTTDYKKEADKLGKAYWGNDEELWARGFEAFVFDAMSGESPYLVTDWVADSTVTKDGGYKGRPYPTSDERGQFSAYFKHLMDNVEWTDAGPTIKPGYTGIAAEQIKALSDTLDNLLPTLEDRLLQLKTGEAKSDGLFWYRFGYGKKRGAGLQPKGHFAFDDSTNEIGYPAALDPSDLTEFGLTPVSNHWQAGENVVYLHKENQDDTRSGKPDGVGEDSAETLGGISPDDGSASETGGRVPRRPAERTGNGEESGRVPSETSGDGSGQLPAGGDENVHLPTERGGTTDLGSGQDAVQPTGTNYRITAKDRIGEGSIETKFTDNIAAITTLKAIEAENRLATPEEQKILARYVGWGGMPQAFGYHYQEGWQAKKEQLRTLLTEDEYAAARASTTNAHFTAPKVVSAMWDAVARLGFQSGRVLEPAVGSGNFFGLMPDGMMHASKLTGIELDPLTARIAKQLYQQANIVNKGYQDAIYPQGFYDLVISNVPFSEADHPVDKKFNKERLNLHDYYFRKSIELTRPGGLIAFITSKGTMDKLDTKARALFAEKADFLGAIRLPQDAFQENANTTVTTDIIFLRRKIPGVQFESQPWLNSVDMELPDGDSTTTMPVNEYFSTPTGKEALLGRLIARRGRYGNEGEVALESDGRDIGKAIHDAIANLPENVMVETGRVTELEHEALLIPADGVAKDGGYTEKDGKLYQREGEMMAPVVEATTKEKERGQIIRDSLKLRDTIRTLLRDRVSDLPEEKIKADKEAIERAYKAFVKKHGYLNDDKNMDAFFDDPDSALLLAIEKWDAEEEKGTRVEIDMQQRNPVEHTDNVRDALIVSLNERGRVDWPTITKLTGMSEELAKAELDGSVFDDPEQGWVTAEEYLSGNVREKLKIAEAVAKADPSFAVNVKALEAALPADLPPSKIAARPGSPWVPGEDIATFMGEMLNVRADRIRVNFLPEIGKWVISTKTGGYKESEAANQRAFKELSQNTEATVTWGTRHVPFPEIMDYALNGGFPVVKYPKDSDGKQEVNRKATAEANAKLQAVKERFSKWVWEDADRSARLSRKYNDEMNGIRLREYSYPASSDQIDADGNIRLPGMAVGMALKPHQAAGVWRNVVSGNTYYGHEVGTGKTFTMVAAAMESKRLNIARKPMFVLMNSTIGQFKAEYLRLYPGANILSMKIGQSAGQRKIQLARIALNDWDAVLVTHESFAKIPMSEAAIKANFQREIDNLVDAVLAAKQDNMSARVVKELEKSKKALENRMKLALDKREKDNLLSFEELGVDQIFVDEAQAFKNLMFTTRMGRQMRGINPEGSGMAFDMFMKTNWLNENLGRGVVMASGTPISNSVGELFTLSRYLQPSELKKRGIQMFDPWANTFGDIGQVAEYLPEGGGYQMVTKFNRFVNIPELMQMVYGVMDAVSADKAKIKRPAITGGKQEAVLVPQNEGVTAYMKEIQQRAIDIRKSPRAMLPDNMLAVVSDGRKAAMDMRMIHPNKPDYEHTKTNAAVDKIVTIYKRETAQRGTQLVFSDLGVPNGAGFNVYADLKKKLVKQGIPSNEIAFIHDAKDDKARKALFAKVNAGTIRVFIGSTKKAGTGVNVQERVAAIHNLDTHWNLANLLQRIGRGQRQGNIYPEISIFNYATEGTVDAFMWDKVQAKGRLIDQIMSGDVSLREAEDISQETMSAAEMVAVASGDPMIAEKVELESAVQKLSLEAAAFDDTLYEIRNSLARIPGRIEAAKNIVFMSDEEAANVKKIDTVTIGEKTYKLADDKTREEMNQAITALVAANRKHADALKDEATKKNIAWWLRKELIGSVTGEGVKYPLHIRAGLGDDYVVITTPAGVREWKADSTIGRGLSSAIKEFEKESERASDEADRLAGELPKLRVEAGKKFTKQDELDKKRDRLDVIEGILTKRDQAEDVASDDTGSDTSKYRFILAPNGEAKVITKFEDISLDEFPGVAFFLHANEGNTANPMTLTHADSGLAFMRGENKRDILKAAKDLIELRGIDAIKAIMEKRDKLTDAQKEEALHGDVLLSLADDRLNNHDEQIRLLEDKLDIPHSDAEVQYKLGDRVDPETGNFYGGGGGMYSNRPNATAGMSADRVVRATTLLRAKWLGFRKVVTVQSKKDLPTGFLHTLGSVSDRAEGVYDLGSNTVYLIADNIATPERAVWVAIHEVVGHGGLRMLGKSVADSLDRAAQNGFVTRLAKAIAANRGDTFDAKTHTDEAIAELAAATLTGNTDAILERYGVKVPVGMRSNLVGMIQRVIAAVRNFIAKMQGKAVDAVSDGDVLGMIQKMKAAVEGKEQTAEQGEGYALASYAGAKYAVIRSMDEDRHLVESNTGERIGVYPTIEKAKQIASNFEKVWMKEYLSEQKKNKPLASASAKTETEESARAKGYTLKVFRGVSKSKPFNESGTVWATTSKEVAQAYAEEVFSYDDADVITMMVKTNGLKKTDMRKASDAELDGFEYGAFTSPQNIGIYTNSDDSPLGSAFKHTVVHVPIGNVVVIAEQGADRTGMTRFSIAPNQNQYGTLTAEQSRAISEVVGQPKTLIERAKEFSKDWQKNMVQGIVDQYAPIKEYSMSAYIKARMSKGSASTLEAIFMYGKPRIDANGDITGDFDPANGGKNGFASVLAPLDGEHDRFILWIAALRAERLKGIGLENLWSKDDIDTLKTLNVGKLQNGNDRAAAYATALKGLNEYNDAILKIASERGLINDSTRKMYQDTPYVPFYRLTEEDVVPGFAATAGMVNQSAWKKLKGGTNKLNEDLLANMLQNWSHLIEASARNDAAKATLTAAVKVGAATEVPNGYPGKGTVSFRDNVVRTIPEGKEYEEGGVTKISDGTAQIEENVERTFMVSDPHLMDAITSISNTMRVPKVMKQFKHMLTMSVTANPAFKLRNLIRDSVQSMALADLSLNPIKNISEGSKLTHFNSETRAKMLFGGGMIRFGSMLDGDSADMARELINKGVPHDHILDNDGKIKGLWDHYIKPAFDAYQELGDRGEQINRAALFDILTKPVSEGGKGMTQGEANYWARDLMDFSMSGKWQAIRFLTQTVPFMNARLQGLYKLGKAAKADKARFGMVVGGVAMASLMLMAAYGDDDDWKKREDWDRDNYWWFKIGGHAFRFPKPFEIGAIGTLAERSAELMFDKEMTGRRFRERLGNIVSQQLSMNPTPQLVKPLIDLGANKDSFSGRPIETMGMDRLKPEDRIGAHTTGVAKMLGMLGMPNPAQMMMGNYEQLSPVQIDFLIRGYFSWLGTSATTVLEYGIFKPLSTKGEAPAMPLRDVFFVGNFAETLPSGSSRYVTQMYNQADEIEQAYNSYHDAMKRGDKERAADILNSDKSKIQQYHSVEAIKRQESAISTRIKLVTANSRMSGEEKRVMIDKLNQQKDQLSRRFHAN